MDLIYSTKVQEREDTLFWTEDKRGSFSAKLFYNSLCAKTKVVFLAKEI